MGSRKLGQLSFLSEMLLMTTRDLLFLSLMIANSRITPVEAEVPLDLPGQLSSQATVPYSYYTDDDDASSTVTPSL